MSAEEQAWLEELVWQIVALKNRQISELEARNRELQEELEIVHDYLHRTKLA